MQENWFMKDRKVNRASRRFSAWDSLYKWLFLQAFRQAFINDYFYRPSDEPVSGGCVLWLTESCRSLYPICILSFYVWCGCIIMHALCLTNDDLLTSLRLWIPQIFAEAQDAFGQWGKQQSRGGNCATLQQTHWWGEFTPFCCLLRLRHYAFI